MDVVLGFLTEAGYRVLVSDGGYRALEQLGRALPDIILLDLGLGVFIGQRIVRFLGSELRVTLAEKYQMSAAEKIPEAAKERVGGS